MNKEEKMFSLEQAADLLLLNVSCLGNIGLYHGKMGWVLFFCQYARLTGCSMYEDFAGELFDEISEDLNTELSYSLEDGLCGIGWGVEYLVQNGFMEGDTDDILKEIDARIMMYDPSRIMNRSMRKGLAGILYYVTIRLSSPARKSGMPFDALYLNALRDVALTTDFSQEREVPPTLVDDFLKALKKERVVVPHISDLFPIQSLERCDAEQLLMKGIEFSWGLLANPVTVAAKNMHLAPANKKHLYLCCGESRSTNYGIGTYVRQVQEALKDSDWEVTVIMFYSSETTLLLEKTVDNVCFIHVGRRIINNFRKLKVSWARISDDTYYYKRALCLLNRKIVDQLQSVFLLNQMDMANLAACLKVFYPRSVVVGIVHYMNWCFVFNGNQELLAKALNAPEDKRNKEIVSDFQKEKTFLQTCDKVIAISKHSLEKIETLYQIPSEKIVLIRHGMKDTFQPNINRNGLRAKYGFKPTDRILIFAGRVETIKGVDLLARAFSELVKQVPNLKLIVAGDGLLHLVQKQVLCCNLSVALTGFVEQSVLQELYAIADVGIVPSLYEDFGYVALEMMVWGLPLVVGDGSGLAEIVEDKETGLIVPLESVWEQEMEELQVGRNVVRLQEKITELFSLSWEKMGKQGRTLFLSKYEIKHFAKAFRAFLSSLTCKENEIRQSR